MDKIDKAKVKVLVKMILINNSPKSLSSKQICDIINSYSWGIRTPITPTKLGSLLNYELKKSSKHFLEDIELFKKGNSVRYSYVGGGV